MNDPVSELLERRLAAPWRWRGAAILALALHGAVAAVVLLTPSSHQRALTLPRVRVRIAAAPIPPSRTAAAPAAAAPSAARPEPQVPEAARSRPQPPARKGVARSTKPVPTAAPPPADSATGADGTGSATVAERTGPTSPQGGIALGDGPGGGDGGFPYAYYLDRVLATIEGNWFRPPTPADVRCRVLCRVDRSGSVLQAGIEEPSGHPAFDRAALRAVYASAPFPPLPQGYRGSALTLHLEFGSR